KKGDKVITTGGIHGKVLELYEDGTCLIECGAGKIKFERAAISMERTAKLNAPVKEKK
ncbi:MAG: preprotein translocase subunit YajC, partial [Aequorivita vladivostokensis]|nr:preprotein translocase subunit YajC [Aequorivita vladivostokensis]